MCRGTPPSPCDTLQPVEGRHKTPDIKLTMSNMSMLWIAVILLSLFGMGYAVTFRCPAGCNCDQKLQKAKCSSAILKTSGADIPESLQYLDLANNSLSSMWQFGKFSFPELVTLDLSHNFITSWNFLRDAFMPKLQELNLQFNQLEILPENALEKVPLLRKLNLKHNRINVAHIAAFTYTPELKVVDLGQNFITTLRSSQDSTYANLSHIETLDLSQNSLSQMDTQELDSLLDVLVLNLSSNKLTYIQNPSSASHPLSFTSPLNNSSQSVNNEQGGDVSPANDTFTYHDKETYTSLYSIDDNTNVKMRRLRSLDLSHNKVQTIGLHFFQHFTELQDLWIQDNKIGVFHPEWFTGLYNLENLDLSMNPILHIPDQAFSNCSRIQYLNISHMPNLTQIHFNAFKGLRNLKELILSNNPKLQYLHGSTFSPLSNLRQVNLQNGAVGTLFPDLFANVSKLESVFMSGNKLHCGCDAEWLFEWITKFNNTKPKFHDPKNILCAGPEAVKGKSLQNLQGYNFSCSPAIVQNYTDREDAMFKVGFAGRLDCIVYGDPQPRITWTTARGHRVLHHPAYINWLRPGPHHHTFHANHPWHDQYDPKVPHRNRVYLLKNGSLYLDYMLRDDAGVYTCRAENPFGNQTISIHVRLDYSKLMWHVKISVAIGYACALGFFAIAVLTAVLRYIAYFCSAEQRQKRRSISEILASLEHYKTEKIDRLSAYKTEKFDRLSAYKSEKIDRLSAYKTEKFDKLSAYKSAKFDQLAQFKTAKVEKIRSYRNLTFTTLVHYIKGMREHYIGQMMKIKENCALQAEKLRETYTYRAGAFKDYRSAKFEGLRESYTGQVLKIRDYGASQMAKLREQYRTQQQHVLKLIELMDIGNCMNIVEAECMRTESMLFDPAELDFDLGTHPVHVPNFSYISDDNESNYETAGSNMDISNSGRTRTKEMKAISLFKPEFFLKHKDGGNFSNPEVPPIRPRKQRRHRHKRPNNLPPLEGHTEPQQRRVKKKRRKPKREKVVNFVYDGDTTAPETPPEQRNHSATATVHVQQETEGKSAKDATKLEPDPSSEYESAHQTREQTPEDTHASTFPGQEQTPLLLNVQNLPHNLQFPPHSSVAGVADVGQALLEFSTPKNEGEPLGTSSVVETPISPSSHTSSLSTPTLTHDIPPVAVRNQCNENQKSPSLESVNAESMV